MNRRTFLTGLLAVPLSSLEEAHEHLKALQRQFVYQGQGFSAQVTKNADAKGFSLTITPDVTMDFRSNMLVRRDPESIVISLEEAKKFAAWIQGL